MPDWAPLPMRAAILATAHLAVRDEPFANRCGGRALRPGAGEPDAAFGARALAGTGAGGELQRLLREEGVAGRYVLLQRRPSRAVHGSDQAHPGGAARPRLTVLELPIFRPRDATRPPRARRADRDPFALAGPVAAHRAISGAEGAIGVSLTSPRWRRRSGSR